MKKSLLTWALFYTTVGMSLATEPSQPNFVVIVADELEDLRGGWHHEL